MSAPSARDLASVPLFRSLGDDQLDDLAELFDVRDIDPDTRLIGEGATGLSFFVLTEGEVAVTTSDGTTTTLGPGEFFGEVALLTEGRRTASVTTASQVRVLVVVGDDFRRLRERYPQLGAEIEATGLARLHAR